MILKKIFQKRLLATTALVGLGSIGFSALADELPVGGSVAAGAAAIQQSGGAMTITQQSDRAVVNWNGFSVGPGNSVTFAQPGSDAAILNRVTGSTTSSIAGQVSGNGQVYLVNPNGIAITPTGKVTVGGGFVASTLDIDDADFMSGEMLFKGDGASAGVTNSGSIAIGSGGYAALIGGTVRNDGVISVPLGKVALGSGEEATLDLSGDGFLQVSVPTAAGAEGSDALIENGGRISADGGSVEIKAATAQQAARHAINIPGTVEANSVGGRSGAIVLGGGAGGRVTVTGKVTAKGSDLKGGRVEITGQEVVLEAAEIDVSGATGGGVVRVGGGYQGGEGLLQADTTLVDADSVIRADATEDGDGGDVVVWSNDYTAFDGLITARGAGSGSGGDAEVSGKALLAYNGFADLRAENGPAGTLLLDPYDLRIGGGANNNVTGTSPITSIGASSYLNTTTLLNALQGGDVTVETGSGGSGLGNIFWEPGWDLQVPANRTLTLIAANDIEIQSHISGANLGFLVLRADSDINGAGQAFTSNNGQIYLVSWIYTNPNEDGTHANISGGVTQYKTVYLNSYADLVGMSNCTGCNYTLISDIDATDTSTSGFNPVLNYYATFDGQNHQISNLKINRPAQEYVGLFGIVNASGVVKNVRLVNANVTGGITTGSLVGALAGTIDNVSTSGTVIGNYNVGGLVGYMNVNATIRYAGSSANTGGAGGLVGGLVGHVDSSNALIEYAYATGNVGGTENIGGLVGASHGQMNHVYATGDVRSTNNGARIGGLVGGSFGGRISQSYATGAVTTTSTVKGALIGYMDGSSLLERSVYRIDIAAGAWGVRDGGSTASQVWGTDAARFNNPVEFVNSYGSGTGVNWNFDGEWSPPINGTPRLYSVNPVVWIKTATSSTDYGTWLASINPITWTGGPGALVWQQRSGTTDYVNLSGLAFAVNSSRDVGTYNDTISQSWTSVSNNGVVYDIVFAGNTTHTVTPVPLTVTANNQSKVYDGGAYYGGNGVTYSGFVNGQNSSVLGGTLSYGGNSQGAVNVGSYTIIPGGYTSNNYTITYQNGVLDVTRKALTASLSGTVAKTYDRTNSATLTSGNYTLNGVLGGDQVFLQPQFTGTYASANAASNINVTVNGLTLTGSSAFNYTVNSTASGLVGRIDKRPVTASLTGTVAKTYDGSAGATLTGGNYTLNGVLGGDQVFLQPQLTGTYASVDAASNINVTVNGLTLTGSSASNYEVNWTASGLVGQINRKLLTLNLTGDVIKTYDRSRTATLTAANYGSLNGVVFGDTVDLLSKPTNGTYDTANAGTSKAVEITGLSLTGSSASNYTINATATANIGRIEQKPLTASLIGDVIKVYDRTDAATLTAANYQLDGVIALDTVSLQSPPSAGTYASVTAGDNIRVTVNGLALTGTDKDNYTVNTTAFANIGQITRKVLTQNLIGTVVKTYDGSDLATLTAANYGTLNGVIAPDIVSLASKPTSGTYDSRNAGTSKTVTVENLTLTGADSGNYVIDSTAFANIGQIDPKTLTVDLAGEVAKIYDGNQTATLTAANYALNGYYSFDDVSLQSVPTSGTYGVATVGSGINVTASGFTLGGNDATNYTVASVASGLVGRIDPKVLTVSLVGDVFKTYDGTSAATLTAANYGALNGVVSGDTVDLLSRPADAVYDSRNAGTGKSVEVSGLTLTGTDSGNYMIDWTASGNVGRIGAKSVTAVLTGEVAKIYDGTDAVSFANGGYALAGAYGFDDVDLIAASSAYDSADVGTGKAITANGLSLTGTSAANYALSNTSVSGNVGTITPAALTVRAADATKIYDGASFSGGNGVDYLGFVNNETVAFLGGALTYGGSAQGAVGAGSYAIDPSGYTSTNYDITYVAGNLTVSPRSITAAADDVTRVYGTQNPPLTYQVINGQLVGADAFSGSLSTAANLDADPGEYQIAQGSLGLSNNYSLTFLPGVLTVEGTYTPVFPGGPTVPYVPGVTNDTVGQGISAGLGQASSNPFLQEISAWGASGLGTGPQFGIGAGSTANVGTITIVGGDGEAVALSQQFLCLGTTNLTGACASLGGGDQQ